MALIYHEKGIFKQECMAVPFILIAATHVAASTRDLGLSVRPLWYKNNWLTELSIVSIKCDFPQLLSPERNKWNSTSTCFPYTDLEMICGLYTKSNTFLCFKLSDLIFRIKSSSFSCWRKGSLLGIKSDRK